MLSCSNTQVGHYQSSMGEESCNLDDSSTMRATWMIVQGRAPACPPSDQLWCCQLQQGAVLRLTVRLNRVVHVRGPDLLSRLQVWG